MNSIRVSNNDKSKVHEGFSLVEATAVIVIVSVLLAILVFGYVRFLAGTAVETASKDIAATLNLAREMSIASNTTHRVTFEVNDPTLSGRQAYRIDRQSADTAGNIIWMELGPTRHFVPDQVRIDVSSSESEFDTVNFSPTGTADSKRIHLINKSEDSTDNSNFYTVQMIPSTARAKVLKNVRL